MNELENIDSYLGDSNLRRFAAISSHGEIQTVFIDDLQVVNDKMVPSFNTSFSKLLKESLENQLKAFGAFTKKGIKTISFQSNRGDQGVEVTTVVALSSETQSLISEELVENFATVFEIVNDPLLTFVVDTDGKTTVFNTVITEEGSTQTSPVSSFEELPEIEKMFARDFCHLCDKQKKRPIFEVHLTQPGTGFRFDADLALLDFGKIADTETVALVGKLNKPDHKANTFDFHYVSSDGEENQITIEFHPTSELLLSISKAWAEQTFVHIVFEEKKNNYFEKSKLVHKCFRTATDEEVLEFYQGVADNLQSGPDLFSPEA